MTAVDRVNVATLDVPALASVYGGPLPVQPRPGTRPLVPLVPLVPLAAISPWAPFARCVPPACSSLRNGRPRKRLRDFSGRLFQRGKKALHGLFRRDGLRQVDHIEAGQHAFIRPHGDRQRADLPLF